MYNAAGSGCKTCYYLLLKTYIPMVPLLKKAMLFIFSCIIIAAKVQAQTQAAAATVLPKIMVMPFTKEGEDIRTILEADVNRRIAITKVQEGFNNRNYTTVDFTAKLKAAMDNQMFASGTQSDIKAQLIEMSGADIYVLVEVPPMVTSNGDNTARLILTAYDCSTGNALSNKVCDSYAMKVSDFGALVEQAVKRNIDDFLNTLQSKFAAMLLNGSSVVVNFNIAQASKYKFSSVIPSEGIPLSDVLETWMESNSYKSYYHIQGSTETKIIFDEVKIPRQDATGKNYSPTKFALKIFQFLYSKQINCTKDVKNGTIFITIN